jgi:6-phosphofructokinase 2
MHNFLTVTLNPTLDVATSVDRLIDHEKLRCAPEQEQVGGGGINVAQVLHAFGADVQALLTTGGYRGQEIEQLLKDDGLPCLSVGITEESRQCFTVYERTTGHEYRFILPGPTLRELDAEKILSQIEQNLPQQWLVLSGSLAPGLPDDFYAQVIGRARLRQPHVKVLVDAAGAPLKQALRQGVDIIKPSLTEFEALKGSPFSDLVQCVSFARELIQKAQVKLVALTLGAQGALMIDATAAFKVEALAVTVTSTVGAGDSFVGGLLWSLASGGSLQQAAAIGTAASAAALQTQGKLGFDPATILAASTRVLVSPFSRDSLKGQA